MVPVLVEFSTYVKQVCVLQYLNKYNLKHCDRYGRHTTGSYIQHSIKFKFGEVKLSNEILSTKLLKNRYKTI